jgi:hypothetical protein
MMNKREAAFYSAFLLAAFCIAFILSILSILFESALCMGTVQLIASS